MRHMREYRSSGLGRPLTLLRVFLVASAVILAIGAVALSSRLSSDLRRAALADNARDVAAYTDAGLGPSISTGSSVAVTPRALRRLRNTVRRWDDVRGLNVYTREGRLVFSTTRPDRIGRHRRLLT
jgi:hypothetical protein